MYEEGRPIGTAPLVLNYTPDESFKRGSCIRLKGTSAKWASGAQASISYLTACPAQGSRQHYTFVRPDVPGRDIDMQFAIQLDRNMAMHQQARAQSAAAAAQMMQAMKPSPLPMPAPLLTPTINCRSTQYGLTVHTQCR